ncbi:MAG: hypothetical protein ABS45_03445 [Comamonas sp. SCN 65-56]|uniref:DUF484 family protein n=1 Tax=Comamonas sp. SCN 65-56 TaxID=1660095 RepID=UPI00086F80D5|nr:DUF484 family protein [Comamonas sp. SCN 65-56]ODS93260.1 MAG: hypothetical protein ABS45_03445 [Comamonas sp. SCN 65-56]
MNSSAIPPITEDDIAQYLANTPEFFERHAQLLTSVVLTSQHGQRAVSLQERQAEMLREKIKGLEQHIMELVRNGGENAAIADKVQQWARRMLAVREAADLVQAVQDGLQSLFDVPKVALRLWNVAPAWEQAPWTQGVSEDVRSFATSLTMPFCGPNLGFEAIGWLPQSAQVRSVALLPMRSGAMDDADAPAFGLLVLASDDAARFDSTMGTDFLTRMAELASAALARLR